MASPIRLPPSTVNTASTGATTAPKPNRAEAPAPAPPEAPDGFSSEGGAVSAQLTGRDGVRSPGQLASDLKLLKDPKLLAGRLKGDLKLQLPELVGLLSLTREQKASRLVAFLTPYACKLAELSAALPLAAGERAGIAKELLEPMKAAGLSQVIEKTTGKTGVEIARELLAAKSPEDVRQALEGLKFDAPQWTGAPDPTGKREPALLNQPPVVLATGLGDGDQAKGKKDRDSSGKVLGRNMLFNVLHLFRVDPKTQYEKEKIENGIVIFIAITLAVSN